MIVNVSEVRINNYNFYPSTEDMVTTLAEHIARDGQLENATVYIDETPNDGRRYTLIGGETRYRAICKLVEEGRSDGDFRVEVIQKPYTQEDEMRLITEDNVQRTKSSEMRYFEIKKLQQIYETLDPKPEGKKRDWIGKMLGISGRMVDIVRKRYEEETASEQTVTRTRTKADLKKSLVRSKKYLNQARMIVEEIGNDGTETLEHYANAINSINTLLQML